MRRYLQLYALCSSSSSFLSNRPTVTTAFQSSPYKSFAFVTHSPPSLNPVHRRSNSPLLRNLSQQLSTNNNNAPKKKMSKKSKKNDPTVPHAPTTLFPNNSIDPTRTKLLSLSTPLPRSTDDLKHPCVIYWMIRDCRTIDNWALLFAQSVAIQHSVPLRVVYTLPPPPKVQPGEGEDGSPPNPTEMSLTRRHGMFLLDGLKVVSEELSEKNVEFDILSPPSREEVGTTIHAHALSKEAIALITDMSPLRTPRQWTETQCAPLLQSSNIPLYQVDAHNIVPVWIASPKREVGARTLRPKIHNVFGGYCCSFPEFVGNEHCEVEMSEEEHDWKMYEEYMELDDSVGVVEGMEGGHEVAMKRWKEFCTSTQQGLKNFDSLRNDPNYASVCTNLSPYINYGQISFQTLALSVRSLKKHPNGTAAFIEEGVVRRELSDNFAYYTPDGYDSLDGAAEWARDSLELHAGDEREHLYTWKELERGETHDDLWNAGQLQLVREGGLHGFMRMYWAKKILEWTTSPSYALATAQYFNDRYAYDGNDPNGFVGVGWSIMGIHDMGWKERPIFGKIRYMNYAGCKRKFKIDTFVARYKGAKENAIKVEKAAVMANKSGALSGKKRKA